MLNLVEKDRFCNDRSKLETVMTSQTIAGIVAFDTSTVGVVPNDGYGHLSLRRVVQASDGRGLKLEDARSCCQGL